MTDEVKDILLEGGKEAGGRLAKVERKARYLEKSFDEFKTGYTITIAGLRKLFTDKLAEYRNEVTGWLATFKTEYETDKKATVDEISRVERDSKTYADGKTAQALADANTHTNQTTTNVRNFAQGEVSGLRTEVKGHLDGLRSHVDESVGGLEELVKAYRKDIDAVAVDSTKNKDEAVAAVRGLCAELIGDITARTTVLQGYVDDVESRIQESHDIFDTKYNSRLEAVEQEQISQKERGNKLGRIIFESLGVTLDEEAENPPAEPHA